MSGLFKLVEYKKLLEIRQKVAIGINTQWIGAERNFGVVFKAIGVSVYGICAGRQTNQDRKEADQSATDVRLDRRVYQS